MGTSKGHGKYCESPEKLYEYFEEYKREVKTNPRTEEVYGGKDFNGRQRKLERPLTHSGFRVFCYHKKKFTVQDYFANTGKRYSDYITICNIIKEEIRNDQIEGGSVGQYNASITQRLNGLTEKQETKQEGEIIVKFQDPKKD